MNTLSVVKTSSKNPVTEFRTDIKAGLDEDTVSQRLAEYGRNEVTVNRSTNPMMLLLRQLQSSVVILLLVASVISFLTHDTLQAVGILIAVGINAAVGFATEWKAQVSLEALKSIAGPSARVVRAGRHQQIDANLLVPGDIIILEAGARVPADAELVDAASLLIDESIMTGESVPVNKASSPIGDDHSCTVCFHGTHVLSGRGRAVVIATGENSSLGKLQKSLMNETRIPTPLEAKLDELGQQLSILTVIICVLISGLGLLYGHEVWEMLEAGIALAVAAVPEGLPVVATLALAIGTLGMVRAGALIRQLAAVETLGCTTVICSDKTGTLTENKLLVTDIYVDGRHMKVSGFGYAPEGKVTEHGRAVLRDPMLNLLMKATALCNDARLVQNTEDGTWKVAGDPTEGALLAAAHKVGLDPGDLRSTNPRISELPFDLVRKKMATVHSTGKHLKIVFAKGSPERIIEDSTTINTSDGPILFSDKLKKHYLEVNSQFAEKGLRVLGVAMKEVESNDEKFDVDLTFLGLVAMKDLPRQGVDEAIKQCKAAGIRVLMLTGDQPSTASSIARDLHILTDDNQQTTIEGSEIEKLSENELRQKLETAAVIARVTPDLKLDIVKALQKDKNIVAMTGDGVNDAPALQQSNIGVAMGLGGTDLARETANMVITDDNFTTIVKAIERGRTIYDNIRRSICYLLTATFASVITIAVAMLSTGLLAINPLQLLWLNLIMHVFPGLGIVMQGAAPGIMQRPPRHPEEKLLGGFERFQIIYRAAMVSLAVLGAIAWCNRTQANEETTTTVAFATISLGLLNQAWAWLFIKDSNDHSRGLVSVNKIMHLMMVISYALVVVAIYLPPVQFVLKTVSLDMPNLIAVAIASTASIIGCIAIDRVRNSLQKADSL